MLENELRIARRAVIQAMEITRRVQADMTGCDTITKSDSSPVTVADFASQAVICSVLHRNFPAIPIVAEESATALRRPENRFARDRVAFYLESTNGYSVWNDDDLFNSIDLGNHSPGDRFWTLDPIDGTKGFLRKEQYAVALALVDQGRVEAGLLGCPNLDHPRSSSTGGCLVSAVRGQGAWMETQTGDSRKACRVSLEQDSHQMRFVESYVSSHSYTDMQLAVARDLGIHGNPVRMDSQVKYAVIATGEAEIYLRIPHPDTPDYKEKIWDHAAGSLIVTEAGGRVTDIEGRELDFSKGKTLSHNRGVLATTPRVHARVIRTIARLEGRAQS
ncbi:MAG TPA: 3'(2'),5'-bisphosphate nucleotidase [Candidatus Aminicenantes bacterium]|nr:3'(2'),5'-bisphosphate nucleotidase [Candidatus Aminicenantes bacterium]